MGTSSAGDASQVDTRRLRVIGFAMVAAVAAFGLVAAASARPPEMPLPPALIWGLAGIAAVALAFGFTLDDPAPPRKVLALALRETAGLIGAVATLLTGSVVWVAVLGSVSVLALLLGIPGAGADGR
jgi:hypothetical protein